MTRSTQLAGGMEGLGEMAMHARFDALEKRLEHPTWPARVDRLGGTPSLVTNRVSNSLIVRGITPQIVVCCVMALMSHTAGAMGMAGVPGVRVPLT